MLYVVECWESLASKHRNIMPDRVFFMDTLEGATNKADDYYASRIIPMEGLSQAKIDTSLMQDLPKNDQN